METTTLHTFPPVFLADGSENPNWDSECREFDVPTDWLIELLNSCGDDYNEFTAEQSATEALEVYELACEDCVIMSERIVAR